MKKAILILGAAAALVLAGCNRGGTSDQYGTSNGTASNTVNQGAANTSSNSPANP
jgi:outer membrane lipoprotein SlyB